MPQVPTVTRLLALILCAWPVASVAGEAAGKDGGVPSVARGNNQFVAVDDNGWSIVSGQVARARTQ